MAAFLRSDPGRQDRHRDLFATLGTALTSCAFCASQQQQGQRMKDLGPIHRIREPI
jgi:hypothetical protein